MGCGSSQTFKGTPEMFDKFQYHENTTKLYFTPLSNSIYNSSHIPSKLTTLFVDKSCYLKCFNDMPETIDTLYISSEWTNFDVGEYPQIKNYYFKCYRYTGSYHVTVIFNNVAEYNGYVKSLEHDIYDVFDRHIKADLLVLTGNLTHGSYITFSLEPLYAPSYD